MNSRRAYLVYFAAAFLYLMAVTQRSSLGVAGLDAQERFSVAAAVLSTLAVVQIIVYAVMQVPVGILLDRLGPRALLCGGALFMAIGQAMVAFSPTFAWALVGRVLVGVGDAATFISAMRLVYSWFSADRSPLLAQWLGNAGQIGQILSALPFALLLKHVGWTGSFASLAAVSLLCAVLVIVAVQDAPRGSRVATAAHFTLVLRRLLIAVRVPATWLGFWTHFSTMMPAAVFSLLWGLPMLEAGLGFPHAAAAALLMLLVVSALVFGPIIGFLAGRFPRQRVTIVVVTVLLGLASWVTMIVWPDSPPLALIIVHILIIGIGGPASMLGFDFGGNYNSPRSMGVVNGIVNIGGFTATFIVLLLTGVTLDLLDTARVSSGEASALYSIDSFRIAWIAQGVIIVMGLVLVLVFARKTRRFVMGRTGIEPFPEWLFERGVWRRTTAR